MWMRSIRLFCIHLSDWVALCVIECHDDIPLRATDRL